MPTSFRSKLVGPSKAERRKVRAALLKLQGMTDAQARTYADGGRDKAIRDYQRDITTVLMPKTFNALGNLINEDPRLTELDKRMLMGQANVYESYLRRIQDATPDDLEAIYTDLDSATALSRPMRERLRGEALRMTERMAERI